jgi:NTE family protein
MWDATVRQLRARKGKIMKTRRSSARRPRVSHSSHAADSHRHEHTVLVLQGGGALGSYQAGVFEGISTAGYEPDWVTGVSIGAINATLIAGNPPERRVERLREFWDRVSARAPIVPPVSFDPLRGLFNRASATTAAMFGVPGFFEPRALPPFLAAEGSPEALSFYDTNPLADTLLELADFDLINCKTVRLSLGAVNVRSGNSTYFDSHREVITPEHVLASGALPPGLPPVEIGGELYWDGGIVSNSPLWYVLDEEPRMSALLFQVDLFSARGEAPVNLDQVQERAKDIQYASKTRFNTTRIREVRELLTALKNVLGKLPKSMLKDPDVQRLEQVTQRGPMCLVHFINRRLSHSASFKDYEFSRATVNELWQEGLHDVHRSMAHPDWAHAMEPAAGMRIYDLTR